jgi:hypothetical protein
MTTEIGNESERLDALDNWIFGDSDDLVDDTLAECPNPFLVSKGPTTLNHLAAHHRPQVGGGAVDDDEGFNFHFSKESYQASVSNLPDSGGRSKEVIVTFEDFEQEEQFACLLLTHHIKNVLSLTLSPRSRKRSLEFVFADMHKADEVSFTTCCESLSVREHVLRTRVHYEYFLRWVICEDMPMLTLPLHDDLINEVMFRAGSTGLSIAKIAWANPGIRYEDIHRRLSATYLPKDLVTAVNVLERSGSISKRGDSLYFTGRNPSAGDFTEIQRSHKRSPIIWSRLW